MNIYYNNSTKFSMVILAFLFFQQLLAKECGRVDNKTHTMNILELFIKLEKTEEKKNQSNKLSTEESFLSTIFKITLYNMKKYHPHG